MPQGRPRHAPGVTLSKKQLDETASHHEKLSLVDTIFEMVVDHIKNGRLTTGQRLHSVRQLAESCEVSRDTVARAYDKLVAHGHLESRAGSGFYVKHAKRLHDTVASAASLPLLPERWRFRLIQPTGSYASTTGLGLLPPEWMDETAIGGALRTVSRASQRALAGYGDPLGYLPLRQQLESKLKGIHVQAQVAQIMVTMGASDAMHLVVTALLRTPGEFVLVEEPGPFLLRERIMAAGLHPLPVPREEDGPDIDKLRALCERYRPRLFFCSSVLQSPTSTQLAPHKAFQILRLAEEFDLTIVEDDTYSDLMPPTTDMPVTRLASLDQLNRVIYIGSFSKTIAPGLRVGFVCANAGNIEWLLAYRTVSQISGTVTLERAVYQLLSQGSYRHHCAQLRTRLDELRQPVMERLRGIGCLIGHSPDAGMYVWAGLPGNFDAQQISRQMLDQGHLMAPGALFSSHADDQHMMRFNISRTLDSPALPALAKLLKA